jgi:TonB family protein
MNPLQKKCILATAGFHLLLLLILFVGPGFFRRETPPVDLPMLKVIPLNAIDAALSSGVAKATPPPVAPPTPVTPPTEPPPTEPTKPVVTPEPVPTPKVMEPAKPVEPDTPEDQPTDKPSPVPVKPKNKHTIDVDLTTVVRKVAKTHDDTAQKEAEARAEARAERDAERKREREISRITGSLEHNLSHSTDVKLPGNDAESAANYGQIVKSLYEQAWIPPDNADNNDASPRVHVVIASDGTVISAHITDPSGDAAVDASVRRALERQRLFPPFPDGATDKERSYNINFDLKAKRMLE